MKFSQKIFIYQNLSYPLQGNPPLDIIHLSQYFFQSSKHFCNALFSITNSSCFHLSFISSIIAQRFPLGWLGFGFNVTALHPWFVTSYDHIEQIWIIIEGCQHLLSDVHAMLFCWKFSNFETIFAAAHFMPKTYVKIAWHEPNDMPTSSAASLILIHRLSKIIFSAASMFSSIVKVIGRPG